MHSSLAALIRRSGKTPAEIAGEAWLPTRAVSSVLMGRKPGPAERGLILAACRPRHSSPVTRH